MTIIYDLMYVIRRRILPRTVVRIENIGENNRNFVV